MNIKHGKVLLWCTVAVFALLRILQYAFVIDVDGFFIRETLWQQLLSDSLYWAMGIVAVLSLGLRISKDNKAPAKADAFNSTAAKTWSFAVALALVAYGIAALLLKQLIGLFALPAAVYFFLLPIRLNGSKNRMLNLMAVFALAYPCAAAINLFFSTFREIKASENVVDTVARCAMILMMIALTKLYMDFEENLGRVSWCFFLYAAFGTLSGVGKLAGIVLRGKFTFDGIMEIVCDIVLWGMAIYLYHKCVNTNNFGGKAVKQLIYAHRGASYDYPENTMLAFQKAVEQGADGIELDVQFTKDKKIIVCHDDNIDRTSNGTGFVEDMTYEELLEYDFGVFKGEAFAGEKIPLLSQVLDLIKESGLLLNIEIKNRGEKVDGLEDAVCNMVHEYELCDKVLYSSFDHEMLRRLKAYDPTAKIGALYSHSPYNALEYMKGLQVQAVHPGKKVVFAQDMCRKALEQGWEVNVWTVDTLEDAEPLVKAGVTSLITNRPAFLRAELTK